MKRILVVNPFGIGDAIFSMFLVEAIRRAVPDAFIGFVCNERTADLARLDASIDGTFVFNRDLFRKLWRQSPLLFYKELKGFLGVLKEARFDTLFDLSLGRQYSLFAMGIGIPDRIGFDFKGRGIFLTRKKKIDGYAGRQAAEIQLELLEAAGLRPDKNNLKLNLSISDAARKAAGHELKSRGFSETDRILALAPGGGKSWGKDARFKQWDPGRFAEAANAFEGHTILLLGDEEERNLLEKTAGFLNAKSLILAGEPIERVSAFLLRSRALLCNDGGLLHLANALGVKTVSIYGPVDEKVYGPFDRVVAHQVVTQDVPCRPCYQKFHFPPCPYDRRCLDHLPAEKVVAALRKVI